MTLTISMPQLGLTSGFGLLGRHDQGKFNSERQR
jgi:hypothetical protein